MISLKNILLLSLLLASFTATSQKIEVPKSQAMQYFEMNLENNYHIDLKPVLVDFKGVVTQESNISNDQYFFKNTTHSDSGKSFTYSNIYKNTIIQLIFTDDYGNCIQVWIDGDEETHTVNPCKCELKL